MRVRYPLLMAPRLSGTCPNVSKGLVLVAQKLSEEEFRHQSDEIARYIESRTHLLCLPI